MARIARIAALAASGMVFGGVALAAAWGDFETAFPPFPCNDGWVGCYQDGDRVTPDLHTGPSGFPTAANARLDWFNLRPTAVFAPFGEISQYPEGGAPAVAAAEDDWEEPPPAPAPRPAPMPEPSGWDEPAPSPRPPAPSPRPEPAPMTRPEPAPMTRPEPAPAPAPGGSMVRPGTTTSTAPAPAPGGSMVRPGTTTSTAPAPAPAPALTRPEPAVAAVAPAPSGPVSCDNLVMLEPMAMMGKLSPEQIACLDGALSAADKQTDKDKLSRVLMANSWAAGDHRSWETQVKRHLEEIDQSDPDLCYKYALFLSKKGAGRAWGVIKWSDVALENRTRWVGETYKSRVFNLYKFRASAAQDLWKAAEEKHASAPTDATRKEVEDARGRTKTFAREWYEYAKEAEKDTTSALQLCISAAGTAEFCEGR